MERTYQPSVTKRKRIHGFLVCFKTHDDRTVLAAHQTRGHKHSVV